MIFSTISLRAGIASAIGVMGVIGLFLAIVTGEIYRYQIIEHDRSALADLLHIETGNQIKQQERRIGELGLAIQHEKGFKEAYENRDLQVVQKLLDTQFHQYFITARVLDVAKIFVLDEDYNVVTNSNEGYLFVDTNQICPEFFAEMKQRSGTDRIRVKNDFCEINSYSYQIVIVPIGSVTPIGYIVIIANPTTIFKNVETSLGLPTMADLHNEVNIYISDKWLNQWIVNADTDVLIADTMFQTSWGSEAFHTHVARDMEPINHQLNTTRMYILGASAAITLLATLIAIMFVRTVIVNPINILGAHLAKIRDDKTHLGENIVIRSNPEIENLANNFNEMSKELKKLYQSLETMAYTDPLTRLANRSQLARSLEYYCYIGQQQNIPFTLLLMDLNDFKIINDSYGHHVGDEILQKVGSRLRKVLRKSDIITNLGTQDLADIGNEDVVARLGGDEFAAILPSLSDAEDARRVAGKVINEMSQSFKVSGIETEIKIGMSIGIAIYPQHGANASDLLRHADIAMYNAKNNGTGTTIYSDGLTFK